MARFNGYLWGFICCLPLGLIMLIWGILIRPMTIMAGTSILVLGLIVLAIAGVMLLVGLIKLGQQV